MKSLFITGTDTNVGKTVATRVLGTLLKNKGIDVGVMKPVQCAGTDAKDLKRALKVFDALGEINPFYAPEPLSPHLAFSRQKKTISKTKILRNYKQLSQRHDLMLVEGAGGLLVPISTNYLMADLAKDLQLDTVIVSRLGLGTINHTLLTVRQAQEKGINVVGIIFVETSQTKKGLAERDNPKIIERIARVPVWGTIPYLGKMDEKTILQKCRNLRVSSEFYSPRGIKLAKRAKQLTALDRQYIWHPFTQMQDWLKEEHLVIERGKSNYLFDATGRRYFDGVSSLWVNVHGHNHPVINGAIKKQIDRISHSTLLGLSNVPAIELAQELVKIAPKGLKKVFYSDNGSTSVEIAIKMAYQYWQNTGRAKKTEIVHLANSYHGDTLGSVSVGGIDLFHKVYRKLIFKTIKIGDSALFSGNRALSPILVAVKEFETLLKKKKDSIAALVVEPLIQGAAGMIIWPKGTLKKMHELCRKHDVLLIVDEVATGFGRTGKMFACQHEGVTPDILCLAKGLTGGYLPLAATLTTQRVFDGFCAPYQAQKTFFHGHTYTGNPLACAAALANLEVFRKEKTIARIQPKIKYLANQLKMLYNLHSVGDVRQCGLMAGIELIKNKETGEPFPWEEKIGVKVCQKVRERGIILRPLGNVIVLMPPLSVTREEIKNLVQSVYWAIDQTV